MLELLTGTVCSGSAFSISAVIWSVPGAFPFLRAFIAALISSKVGASTEMSSSSTSMFSSSGGDSGVVLFRTSSKCSFHLASLASLFFSSSPSLFFAAAACQLFRPVSCFMMWYSSVDLPFSAAFCALSALCAIHLL